MPAVPVVGAASGVQRTMVGSRVGMSVALERHMELLAVVRQAEDLGGLDGRALRWTS